MIDVDALVAAISALQREDLDAWIRDELVAPQKRDGTPQFSEMECARVRLICTLSYDLEVDAEALPVVMSLVDQLYDTRRQLLSLAAAVSAQDRDVQAAIMASLTRPDADIAADDE